MNKAQLAYLTGITFVSIGLIPTARSIFSIELLNDAPIFFLVGGIWFLLIIVFIYSSKESQRQFSQEELAEAPAPEPMSEDALN